MWEVIEAKFVKLQKAAVESLGEKIELHDQLAQRCDKDFGGRQTGSLNPFESAGTLRRMEGIDRQDPAEGPRLCIL